MWYAAAMSQARSAMLLLWTTLSFAAGKPPPPAAPPAPFDILLLPQSHQDAGFIVTYSYVRDRLSEKVYQSVYEELSANSQRRFNVAEINFFSRWYDQQNSTVQQRVKAMVAAKQYDFVEGGWVQPDEAATTYQGRINQATMGQQCSGAVVGSWAAPRNIENCS